MRGMETTLVSARQDGYAVRVYAAHNGDIQLEIVRLYQGYTETESSVTLSPTSTDTLVRSLVPQWFGLWCNGGGWMRNEFGEVIWGPEGAMRALTADLDGCQIKPFDSFDASQHRTPTEHSNGLH